MHLFRSVASPAGFPIKARWGGGPWGSVWPDNVQETGVSPGGRSGSPIVAAEAEQVERTTKKDLVTRPIGGFCALQAVIEPSGAIFLFRYDNEEVGVHWAMPRWRRGAGRDGYRGRTT